MQINDIAVFIFTFIAACVFIVCAANIVVQLRIHDLKRLLQNEYDVARQRLVNECEEANLKFTNEIASLKIEIKAIRNQVAQAEAASAEEELSSADVLGRKKSPESKTFSKPSFLKDSAKQLH